MTKSTFDNLFSLIKSLSKSEKRQFKLYVGRLLVNDDAKFLLLFGVLDKQKEYNEQEVLNKGFVKKQQLPNLKAHLYKQILVSLRLSPSNKNIRIEIREQLDFATILYNKGLYNQSLKILDKAKSLAVKSNETNLIYEIIEFEKIIESQYITRSIGDRASQLLKESREITAHNNNSSELSNLSLEMYSRFLKVGYVKSNDEHNEVASFFNSRMKDYDLNKLGFTEKLWYFKSYLWYSFLTHDFLSCYKYALKWVELFEGDKNNIQFNPVYYLRGNQYLLESLFLLQNPIKFKQVLKNFEEIYNSNWFPRDDNIKTVAFINLFTNKLNLHFMEGTFKDALPVVNDILKTLNEKNIVIDQHYVLVFYYKIASIYFCLEDYEQCIFYLNKIINDKALDIRQDLMCFSRILNLVAHYEAALDYDLDKQVKSTFKFLIEIEDLYEVQKQMVLFLRKLPDVSPNNIKQELKTLHNNLKVLETHPYEKRAFLYLDILSWLESKIENISVSEVIQSKFKKSKK